jgi:hypothetical protein
MVHGAVYWDTNCSALDLACAAPFKSLFEGVGLVFFSFDKKYTRIKQLLYI